MKNKAKLAVIIALALAIALALVSFVHGAGILDKVVSLYDFEKSYDKNPKAWDFFMFSIIFNLIIWLGLIKAFPENKGIGYFLALVLGILFGLAAVKAEMSLQFFIPFVKNIMFFIIFFIVFFVLLRFEMNKIVALILALVITFVAFNVMGLFGKVEIGKIDLSWESAQSLEEMQYSLDKLALEYDVGINDDENIAAKVSKLREKLRQEQEHLSAVVRDAPSDEASKLRLQRVREILLSLSQIEKKGKELEKNAAEAASAGKPSGSSGATATVVSTEDIASLKEELARIKKMKAKTFEERKKKDDAIRALLKKINDVKEQQRIATVALHPIEVQIIITPSEPRTNTESIFGFRIINKTSNEEINENLEIKLTVTSPDGSVTTKPVDINSSPIGANAQYGFTYTFTQTGKHEIKLHAKYTESGASVEHEEIMEVPVK